MYKPYAILTSDVCRFYVNKRDRQIERQTDIIQVIMHLILIIDIFIFDIMVL